MLLDETDDIDTDDEGDDANVPWLPSPEEIRAACIAIQSQWSDQERERRRAWQAPVAWMPPGAARGAEVVDRETVSDFLAW